MPACVCQVFLQTHPAETQSHRTEKNIQDAQNQVGRYVTYIYIYLQFRRLPGAYSTSGWQELLTGVSFFPFFPQRIQKPPQNPHLCEYKLLSPLRCHSTSGLNKPSFLKLHRFPCLVAFSSASFPFVTHSGRSEHPSPADTSLGRGNVGLSLGWLSGSRPSSQHRGLVSGLACEQAWGPVSYTTYIASCITFMFN